jgi:hypothetical protein
VAELRRQWRGYAAGRAWLARRYEGFAPEPAVVRVFGRLRHRTRAAIGPGGTVGQPPPRSAPRVDAGRLERGRYLALDALLSADELAGLALSNRPAGRQRTVADVVMVADRFPARGDPLVEFVGALERVRVEAGARPELPDVNVARNLQVDYREDDGIAARVGALLALVMRHPLRVTGDLLARRPGEPGVWTLAPAVLRLQRDRRARVHVVGGEDVRAIARRLARLAGRPLEENARRR